MFSIFLSIFIIQFCFLNQIFCQQKGSISFDNKNITIITKLNEQVTLLQQPFLFSERAEKWLFGVDTSTRVVFENGELKDKARFQCKAVTDRCDSLTILKTTKNELGQYVRTGSALDNTKITYTSYYLSAFESPLDILCSSLSGLCKFNSTTNVLSVKENDPITLTCIANFWRSDQMYAIPASMFYRSTNNEECMDNDSKFINGRTDPTSTGKAQNIQLKKDCTRSFTNSESGSSFICGLRYDRSAEASRNDEIERLNIKIDVHFGPISLISSSLTHNQYNSTIKQGSTTTLKCPYDGNPITYYWKITGGQKINSDEFISGKEYTTLKDLEPGTYQYQCTAYVGGYINTRTEPTKFTVRIIENQVTTKKGNLPAIIGGTVGGAVLLILIIILVIYLVKCRQNGYKEHEVNKTKESNEKTPKAPILRKDKPIYKNKNDEEAVSKPLNDFNGTDPANNEFDKYHKFSNITNSPKSLDETVPLNEAPIPSKRGAKPQTPTYPNIINETKSATEMLNDSSDDSSGINGGGGIYSPSVAEARRLDAAAPGANLSRAFKDNTDLKTNLAIKAGGHKVLPTEEDLKKILDIDLTDNRTITGSNNLNNNHHIIKNINRNITSNNNNNTNQKLYTDQQEQLMQQQQQQQQHLKTNNFMVFNQNSSNNNINNNGSHTTTSNIIQMINQHQPNASSYAAIAHAAAAAAASYSYSNTTACRKMSYNNPSFYETNSYSIQTTGESPPSYDAALKQQPNDSPQLLNNKTTYQSQTPQHQQRQQHYQSQTLLNNTNKDFTNSNLKLNIQQQQQFNSGSTSKIAVLNGSSKNLNSNILMNPNGGNLMQPQYQPPNLPINNNNIEYSDVVINRARNREPLPFNNDTLTAQQQQQQTQYSTVPTFISKPSMV